MKLVQASVGPYKSIEKSGTVTIDPKVTVLVGMNEAGKTAFLHALNKSKSIEASAKFEPIEDYPRKDLAAYLKRHNAENPDVVTQLTYQLDGAEVSAINAELGTTLKAPFEFTVHRKYDNSATISIDVDERPVISALLKEHKVSTDAKKALKSATTLREVATILGTVERTPEDDALKADVDARIAATKWADVVSAEVWDKISPNIPRFLYFDDYYTLPGKVNLQHLAQRVNQEKKNGPPLDAPLRAVLALLRMADISITDLTNPAGYETIKAKLEAISISITDQVFEFWKQNETLEVEFDIQEDPKETTPPFNDGANLYIRIKNKRHRVTVPFDKRSKGFIWFFSFLVWFDSVQEQQAGAAQEHELILLLDEPGLSLHALAQDDFLRYIDDLSKKHQVIYTTHSPFMIHPDRLNQVRVVEDRAGKGTEISDKISGYDAKTLFPLQAALGYSIAQNLFIAKRNLLIEGPSDLIYLRYFSSRLEEERGIGLRPEITLVPAGGLDKVATFVALLGANQLELAVLHDSIGKADQRIAALVKQKMIPQDAVLTFADFRDVKAGGKGAPSRLPLKETHPATDVEDLLDVDLYLGLFNKAFAAKLGGKTVTEGDLPKGDRIIGRLTEWLDAQKIILRKEGGFNHYTVAAHLASNPPKEISDATRDRFHVLFDTVNGLYSAVAKGESV